MQFEFPTYRLEFTPDPFAFELYRGERRLFASDPYPEPLLELVQDGPSLRLRFPSATLELILAEASVLARWDSATGALVRQTFPLLGHWYGQGELIHQLWPLNRLMLW